MIITITQIMGTHNKCMDIQVNEEQKIIDTLQVLYQTGLIQDEDIGTAGYVYSERNKQIVNTQLTYKQAMIFNGDILVNKGAKGYEG